jgi:asparagine synthase (glutamine-hydrolysing)
MNFEDRVITFYRDILRLSAAHSLTINCANKLNKCYWSLDPQGEVRLKLDTEYVEVFRKTFIEAVRSCLRSDFSVGSTLSGGLDSSSIACTARHILAEKGNQQLHTFSAIFPSLPQRDLIKIDERRYIEAVLTTGGFVPHYVRADWVSPLVDLERVLWHQDEAVFGPGLYMHWALYKAAHKQTVRIFLDGIDGDTVISHGLEYLTDLTRKGRWRTLFTEASLLAARSPLSISARQIIWRQGFRPLMPEAVMHFVQRARGNNVPPCRELTNPLINPAFAQRISLASREQHLLRDRPARQHSAKEAHWLGLRSGLFQRVLELSDKAAAAFQLEPRYPFFDRRLIELSLAIPPEQKLKQGWTRAIMRHSMADILPDEVRWRFGKANLGSNFKRRLLDYERDTLNRIIFEKAHIIEDYVNVSELRTAYQQYSTQAKLDDKLVLAIYSVITLALWLDRSDLAI